MNEATLKPCKDCATQYDMQRCGIQMLTKLFTTKTHHDNLEDLNLVIMKLLLPNYLQIWNKRFPYIKCIVIHKSKFIKVTHNTYNIHNHESQQAVA